MASCSIVGADWDLHRRTDEAIADMRDWVKLCLTNKSGNGDRTGLLPEKALKMISQSRPNLRLPVRRP